MFKIIILGAIQGLTEFLPVSSSGHLVVVQRLLGLKDQLVFLDISLHIGTLLSLATFFYKDIAAACRDKKMILLILIVTIVTGAIGLTFKTLFESFFELPRLVSIILVLNGAVILLTQFIKKGGRLPGYADSALMGLSQGLAIAPGISRSGATISTLLLRHIDPQDAFRFSFLASIPAILGAFILEAKDILGTKAVSYQPPELVAGIVASYAFGLLALIILKKSLLRGYFHLFGYYCILAGTTFFFLST
ncbi:MAG: undecaprenyl-diphosphate phosphatase [Candidatus Omnitrophica bacterium]|nr:undecaprenyl-diphosphate phosphatase [Candidatus Omnitrophota bacterium]